MSYEEIRANLAEAYHWTFAEIDDMSFEQISSACRKGKRPAGIPIHSVEDVQRIAKEWRRYYGV